MRPTRLYLTLLPLVAVTLSTASAADLGDLNEPFDLQADRMEYTNNSFIASGSVTGLFENVMIRADKVTGNPETGDLHAEGHILFERDQVLWQGSTLDYNFLTQAGLFGPSSLYFDPVSMSVDYVERVSTNEFLLRKAVFTTCLKNSPHISFRAKEARLIDEKYIKAKGVTFYVGSLPVMYVPFWNHTLKDRVFSFQLGYDNKWGASALTRITLPVTKEIASLTDVNYYAKRGVGVGQGFSWGFPKANGQFTSFYLNDRDPHAKFNSPTDMTQIDEDRYSLNLEHIQNFTDTHYLNTEWNYLSDPAVLEEFFKDRYRNNAQPENYGSWVYGNSTIGTEGFASKRLNDFYNNTDRVESSADLYRTQIGDSPFYFGSENSISHLKRVHSKTNAVDEDYESTRIDTLNTVYLPQRYGFLNVIPRASYRATYYSKTSGSDDDEKIRQIPSAGINASFQATKILSDTERWYGKGIRHKIEPYADYSHANSSTSTNRLLQFDAIDQLEDEDGIKLGLRNILQTKRDGHLSKFIDLDLYTYYRADKNGAEHTFDDLFIDARMPLTQNLILDIDGIYDWYGKTIDYFNTRVSYKHDDVTFSMEHLYQESERLSLWTPRFNLYPKGNVSFETYLRYNDNENDIQEVAIEAYKKFCCMRYGFGYHYTDGDQSIMFSIGLSAFPDERITSGF